MHLIIRHKITELCFVGTYPVISHCHNLCLGDLGQPFGQIKPLPCDILKLVNDDIRFPISLIEIRTSE